MKYDAVLFDLDGTLLDTIEDLTDAMNASLAEMGFPGRTVEECKFFVGEGREAFAARALPAERRDGRTVARCVELMTANYGRNWSIKTRPYEGIEPLLSNLARRGVAMAVLSNKYEATVRMMVDHFFAEGAFRSVNGAGNDLPLKPDPASALAIARRLGLAPGRFLYVGDTAVDMRTARAAGMYAVGALWGFRPKEELAAAGADELIARPAELLGLL